jgi:hypothetical protein
MRIASPGSSSWSVLFCSGLVRLFWSCWTCLGLGLGLGLGFGLVFGFGRGLCFGFGRGRVLGLVSSRLDFILPFCILFSGQQQGYPSQYVQQQHPPQFGS